MGIAAGGQLTILDTHGVNQARFDAQTAAGMLEEEVELLKGETQGQVACQWTTQGLSVQGTIIWVSKVGSKLTVRLMDVLTSSLRTW